MTTHTRSIGIAASALGLAIASACIARPPAAGDTTAPAAAAPAAMSTSAVDSTGQLELRTDRATYRAGEKGTLTIVNRGALGWSFNPCTRTLEREDGGTWTAVPEGRMCTMEAWILKPHETRTAPLDFGPTLGAGRYRLVIGFVGDGDPAGRRIRARTAPVTITR